MGEEEGVLSAESVRAECDTTRVAPKRAALAAANAKLDAANESLSRRPADEADDDTADKLLRLFPGSWHETARNITVTDDSVLRAELQKVDGSWTAAQVQAAAGFSYANDDGTFALVPDDDEGSEGGRFHALLVDGGAARWRGSGQLLGR